MQTIKNNGRKKENAGQQNALKAFLANFTIPREMGKSSQSVILESINVDPEPLVENSVSLVATTVVLFFHGRLLL